MFDNFLKWNSGKTNVRVIATLLVFTLTFANFAILGSFLTESIARDNTQNNLTNADNVKFTVYLDEEDMSKTTEDADINSEDITLYASVKVENEGSLEKAKISFANSNFKLKDSDEQEVEVEAVAAGEEKIIPFAIVARKDSNYNLNLLSMQSEIRLTGDYINSNQEITAIDTTKEIKINWNTNSISKEQINLSQEVITNKIFNINGENKRVVQVLIKTNIEDNKAPVKNEKITVKSSLSNEVAKNIKVTTLNKLATNGQNEIGFNNNVGSTYAFDSDNNLVTIELKNEADEQGNIAWQKNAQDELIVTYIYEEDIELTSYISEVKANYEVYGTNTTYSKEVNYEVTGKLPEKEETLKIENAITENIYKGNMYIGEETSYYTGYDVYLNYANIANNITVNDLGENKDGLNTKFVKTTINKEQALNILGEEGKIEIYDNSQNPKKLVEINISEVTEDEITYEYQEDVSIIKIVTSTPINAGILRIKNAKAILAPESKQTISELQNLESKVELNDSKNANAVANVLEPITTIEMSLDKESISNQIEDTLRITAVLKAVDNSNKLFVNPVLSINLPEEFEETQIVGVELVNGEELSIKTNKIENNILTVELEGEQTKYTENTALGGANIVIDLKVKSQKFMADKNVVISATCINDAETAEISTPLNIVSKQGLNTKTNLVVGENRLEELNKNEINVEGKENEQVTAVTSIINNYGEKLTNSTLLVNIPENAALNSAVLTNVENAQVYYSEDLNASQESFSTEVADFSNVKAVKIELNKDVEQGEEIQLGYSYILGNNDAQNIITLQGNVLEEFQEQVLEYNVKVQKEVALRTVATETEKVKVEIGVISAGEEITDEAPVKEGQMLEYDVKVTNVSNAPITNLNIEATKENGNFYTKTVVENPGQGTDVAYIYKEDSEKTSETNNVATLNPGDTAELQYKIIVNKNTAGNNLLSNVRITADDVNEIQINKSNTIEQGKIKVLMQFGYTDNVKINSGDDMKVIIKVENITNNNLSNVKVKYTLPAGLTYIGDSWETESGREINGQTLTYTIDELAKDSVESITVYSRVGDFEGLAREINSQAIVEVGEEQYKSNIYTNEIEQAKTSVVANLKGSLEGDTIKDGDKVTYTLTLKNNGPLATDVTIQYELLGGLEIQSITKQKGETQTNLSREGNLLTVEDNLQVNEELVITINAKFIKEDLEPASAKFITNKAIIRGDMFDTFETNEVTYKIEDPVVEPDKPSEPSEPDKKYSISGLAWIDENKDGIRDENEKILQGIKVILLDNQGKQLTEQVTTIAGTYKFTDLKQGEYTVAFKYDLAKYSITKYQVTAATEQTNSDVIAKEIEINGEKVNVGLTDVMKVENKDIANVDIGLVEIGKFDLRVDKYISKVIVLNNGGTTSYEYKDTNFTKIEISAKKMAGTVLLIEYELRVTNEGDVDAYVEDLLDYIPTDLVFTSESNQEWYSDSNNVLHNKSLAQQVIKPKETKSVKLVLTKTLKSDSSGTIENITEIGASRNLYGIADIDSVAGNKKIGEDDINAASLIVSIATGSPTMYIGIVLASVTILTLGIYIINKKVLKESI